MPVSQDDLYGLAARLAVYPRHQEAIPVVAILSDGIPHILGNARTGAGAKMLGCVYGVEWPKAAQLSAMPTGGDTVRQFFLLRTVL